VQAAQRQVRQLGYDPIAIGLAAEAGPRLRYVFAREKRRRPLRMGWAAAAVFLAASLFGASLLYAASHHAGRAALLTHAADAVKTEALKAQTVKAQAETMVSGGHLLAGRAQEPRVLDVLLEVTRALPDDSWLSTFELNGNEVHLIGTSRSASSLIERLAAVPLFEHPHFRSAITPQTASREKGAERFDIALTVRGRHKSGEVR
jgi:general secretion pathway protein L